MIFFLFFSLKILSKEREEEAWYYRPNVSGFLPFRNCQGFRVFKCELGFISFLLIVKHEGQERLTPSLVGTTASQVGDFFPHVHFI